MDEQIAQRRNQPRDQSLSAIDRLQRRQDMMAAASTRANEVLEAAKPLYAVLSDEQKKDADALLSRGDRRGDHQGGHRSEHREQRHGHGSRWH
jgi:ABC-type transporter Mla subunit MlaD